MALLRSLCPFGDHLFDLFVEVHRAAVVEVEGLPLEQGSDETLKVGVLLWRGVGGSDEVEVLVVDVSRGAAEWGIDDVLGETRSRCSQQPDSRKGTRFDALVTMPDEHWGALGWPA